jgi:lysophospholipase L1-like esterase
MKIPARTRTLATAVLTVAAAAGGLAAVSRAGAAGPSHRKPVQQVAETATGQAPAAYVNIGDSFSAGEGTYAPYQPGTDTSTNKCHRSDRSYSGQYVAMSTRYHAVKNAACAGAVTADITQPPGDVNSMQIPSKGEPAQRDALGAGTSLVTMTIGGNDLNLGGIFNTCYGKVRPDQVDACFISSFDKAFFDRIDALRATLDGTYTAVRNAAPHATIVVLTYPQTYPAAYNPRQCQLTGRGNLETSQRQLDLIHQVISRLNTAVKAASHDKGLTVLDEERAFAGHEECTTQPWVQGINNFGNDDESLHPTPDGYHQEAVDLHRYLDAIA